MAINLSVEEVDRLVELVDPGLFAAVLNLAIALQRGDPVPAVRFERLDEFCGTVPRIEEISLGQDLGVLFSLLNQLIGQFNPGLGVLSR